MIFAADLDRRLALEIKGRALTLYTAIAPILLAVNAWALRTSPESLPSPYEVRIVLEQIKALKLERIRQDDLVLLFLKAGVGDTLSYVPKPTTAYFDGSGTFG
jgi:hypothetical protein